MSLEAKATIGPNLGLPFQATIDGKEIQVQLLTQGNKARVEKALMARKRKYLLEDKPFLSDREFQLVFSAHYLECATGVFAFEGEACKEWTRTNDGSAAILEICGGHSHDFWYERCSNTEHPEHEQTQQILIQIWRDSFPNLFRLEQ